MATNEYQKAYRAAHREKSSEYISKWRAANPDKVKAQSAKYRIDNAAKVKAAHKKWSADNPDKKKSYNNKHYAGNTEKIKSAHKKWRGKNSEYISKWRDANPEAVKAINHKRRASKAGNGGSFSAEEWRILLTSCKNKCLRCGEERSLTADHVVPVSKGGSSNIDNIQPLCGPCNSSKGAQIIDYRR